ncbi:protein-glutamate O-methyltransferase CheR [Eubacteriales bacterium OttesenSCG-928-M02]|nr:protein-glutamate O-methyltransferase CheR [Eubacteriales bacterium OttesenSCG-928-M02]
MIRLTDREFNTFTEYLKQHVGINLTKKRTLIEGRMNNYLLNHGYDDYGSYLNMLFNDKTGQELSRVVNYLTTNYSYFMREWEHFEYYKTTILPQWKERISNRDLRVWSAGCSTGEEPYTLAMITDEFLGKESAAWDKRILATDISERVLNHAKEGIYTDEGLEKVPAMWKTQYFNRLPDGYWQVKDSLKKEVIFRFFNLMDPVFPFKKKFHVIFCRNVMIYFDTETKAKVVQKYYDALEEGGYLIVGQSESVDRTKSGFRYVMPAVYKKERS